jgi:uncharacterized membrane protein YphA (DoxX/SURF4 family)
MKLRHLPTRIATGGYILHSGLEKWEADEQTAGFIHGMAAGAYPFIKEVPPTQFVQMWAGAEIALGSALLLPLIPTRLAGLGLSAFASALLTMYMRTPSLHNPGSIWPTQQGIGISKDVWMLGIGLSYLIDSDTGKD